MWEGELDGAAIKATLNVSEWVEGEDDLDLTYLADKMCSKGLSAAEQAEYDALQALCISGY